MDCVLIVFYVFLLINSFVYVKIRNDYKGNFVRFIYRYGKIIKNISI